MKAVYECEVCWRDSPSWDDETWWGCIKRAFIARTWLRLHRCLYRHWADRGAPGAQQVSASGIYAALLALADEVNNSLFVTCEPDRITLSADSAAVRPCSHHWTELSQDIPITPTVGPHVREMKRGGCYRCAKCHALTLISPG
jgi:hypothetical protein